MQRTSSPVELLGNLTAAARRYNELWLALERSAESTDVLRSQIMAALFDERGIDDTVAAHKLSEAYGEIRQESGVLPYPGIDDLLVDLKSNYKLGLLTNGPTDIQWEKIEDLGFDKHFDAVIVAGDVGIYKPDVRIFEMLLEKLSVAADHSLFVGDTYEADILGAQQAGMYTAWIKRNEDVTANGVRPTLVKSDTALLRGVLL